MGLACPRSRNFLGLVVAADGVLRLSVVEPLDVEDAPGHLLAWRRGRHRAGGALLLGLQGAVEAQEGAERLGHQRVPVGPERRGQPAERLPAAPEAAPAGVAPAAPAGCTKDVDCKGDRVCEQGTCVPPRVKEAP